LSRQGSWNIYNQYLATEGIEFFDEFRGVDQVFQRITCQPNFSQRRWADAYLAAHALSSGSRIVSFDSDFTTFEGLDFLRLQG
ncbi:MAG: putative nucleic acid-binding protein, partial [Verrucomicrobiales bacterium]